MASSISSASNTSKIEILPSKDAANSRNSIDKLNFLELMLAKLANQNPLEPTDDSEFLGQLAQFDTLTQMQNLNTTLSEMSATQAFNMTGKYVVAEYNSGYIRGRIDSVIYDQGSITLDIGGALVSVDSVKEVFPEKPADWDNPTEETTPDVSDGSDTNE